MWNFIRKLFAVDFMPHVYCLREPAVIWLHVASDALIAAAYFLIPLGLISLVRQRHDLAFRWTFLLFGAFILACGLSHALDAYTLWHPIYRFEGVVKAVTALVSLPTAFLFIRLVPMAIALPSPARLRQEVEERSRAEAEIRQLNAALENKVAQRTSELAESEARLYAILNGLPASVYMKDLQGRYQFVNRQFESDFGFTSEEARGKTNEQLLSPELVRQHQGRDALVLTDGPVQWEDEVQKAGELRAYLTTKFALRNQQGQPYALCAMAVDITERRRHRRALLASEARQRAFRESASVGIFEASYDGRLLEVNPGLGALLGYPSQELVGRPFQDLVFPEDRSSQLEGRHERRLLHKNGSLLWTEVAITPLSDPDQENPFFVGVVLDIDARKRTEQELERRVEERTAALQTSEERLRLAQQAGGIGTWEWSVEQNQTILSERAGILFGFEPGESLPTRGVMERVHPDDSPRVYEQWDASRSGHTLFDSEFRVVWKDGSVHWLVGRAEFVYDESGNAVRAVGINLDVTERRRAEEALRQSGERFRTLAAAMPGVLYTADANGSLTYSNTYFQEYTGLSARELLGQGWLSVVHPEDLGRTSRIWKACLLDGRSFEVEHRFRRHDGVYRWQLNRCVPLRNQSGQPQSWYGTSTDIDERKQAEAHLEQIVRDRTASLADTVAELKQALSEKTVLLKEVHHRVKNNLAVIASLLGMQAESLTDNTAILSLTESQQRVQSMALIHEHLYGTEHLDSVNFAEYAQQLSGELYTSFVGGYGLVSVTVDAQPLELGVDRAIPCGLILNELLSNAFKYAFPGGRAGEITVGFNQSAPGQLCLSVEDDGVGVPENLDWRNAPSLGMQIVQILAQQLGGSIDLERPGQGVRFVVRFPYTPVDASGSLALQSSDSSSDGWSR